MCVDVALSCICVSVYVFVSVSVNVCGGLVVFIVLGLGAGPVGLQCLLLLAGHDLGYGP